MLFTHLQLGLPSGIFPSVFPTNNLYPVFYFPINTTCPVHLILNLIIPIIVGEEYKSRSSSYADFSTLSSHHPSLLQIFNSAPCSQTFLVFVLPLISKKKFHNNTDLLEPIFTFFDSVRWVPLSPRHGASSGCGW
jgi:hypothetical protein